MRVYVYAYLYFIFEFLAPLGPEYGRSPGAARYWQMNLMGAVSTYVYIYIYIYTYLHMHVRLYRTVVYTGMSNLFRYLRMTHWRPPKLKPKPQTPNSVEKGVPKKNTPNSKSPKAQHPNKGPQAGPSWDI